MRGQWDVFTRLEGQRFPGSSAVPVAVQQDEVLAFVDDYYVQLLLDRQDVRKGF